MKGSTVQDAIEGAVSALKDISDPDPRRTARILLCHAAGLKEIDLIKNTEFHLSEEKWNRFVRLVNRRLKSEPLQYIIGEWEFFGRPFKVGASAYIPRPETEFIIEAALKYMDASEPLNILDIGTGSGAISVTLACEFTRSRVTAVDINPRSIQLAAENALRLGVRDRMSFIVSDSISALNEKSTFDIIATNPPYVPDGEYLTLQKEITVWEPPVAFTGGEDGLDFVRQLLLGGESVNGQITPVEKLLKPGGLFISEFGWKQRDAYHEIISKTSLELIETIEDYNGIPRTVVCKK